jgi:hypothetical protein
MGSISDGRRLVIAACLLLCAGTASAQEKSGDWDITIGAGPG